MLSSSQDLLYIVLSLSILWFTVFLCWLLYQAARVLKNANLIIENVTHKLELITEAVSLMKEKMDGISSSMGTMGKMLTGLIERFVANKIASSFEERMETKQRERASSRRSKVKMEK